MYDLLIDRVFSTFAEPGESETGLLQRLQEADRRLWANFRQRDVVASDLYAEPMIRAAYLLRYLGHYTLQLGDLMRCVEGVPEVAAIIAKPNLRVVALCGGPCPEAIALAILHRQAGGLSLKATVLDRQADHWRDCWPISAAVAEHYGEHPCVRIEGYRAEFAVRSPTGEAALSLSHATVLTLMNGLNELIALGEPQLRQRLRKRLNHLPPGALVLASDQASYGSCQRGMGALRAVLHERGAQMLVENMDPANAHVARNNFDLPARIAPIYTENNPCSFRKQTKQLQLVALLP